MKVVVDSNVLFTFFWKDSVFRMIGRKQYASMFSPEYALEEIKKHSNEIKKKAKLSDSEFKKTREELVNNVIFVPIKEYAKGLRKAKQIMPEDLLDDIDFLALAIELNCPLWSNDKMLKSQKDVPVFDSKDMAKIMEF
jgi:predicted nucleic acid-binding protein